MEQQLTASHRREIELEAVQHLMHLLIQQLKASNPDAISALEKDAPASFAEYVGEKLPADRSDLKNLSMRNAAIQHARQVVSRMLTGRPHQGIGEQPTLL